MENIHNFILNVTAKVAVSAADTKNEADPKAAVAKEETEYQAAASKHEAEQERLAKTAKRQAEHNAAAAKRQSTQPKTETEQTSIERVVVTEEKEGFVPAPGLAGFPASSFLGATEITTDAGGTYLRFWSYIFRWVGSCA